MNELVLVITITIRLPMPPEERDTPAHENDSAA